MMWIAERSGKDIPDCLFYDGWQTDRDIDGQTPLILWINW